MDFPNDTQVNNIGDQYMFGPSLMVAPVYQYQARNREVYFPAGTNWYDFYSGKPISGGHKLSVDAPYEQLPLFVKAGAIVPFGPEINYTGEKPADTITLYVYTGQNGQFNLYEDEAVNYNYEKGKYTNIPLLWDEATGKLTIGERQGQFDGMLTKRTFNIVWVTPEKPVAFNLGAQPAQSVIWEGQAVEVIRK